MANPTLEFSTKYHEEEFPDRYATKHGESLSRRLNDRREQRLLEKCLVAAGDLESVADIGCGPGRFWPVLHAHRSSERSTGLYALDVSHAMLRYARERYPDGLGRNFSVASGSVTALPFVDGAFDCVVSMRLLHHFGGQDARRQALGELARTARRYVIVSLWTDGNYKAWRRSRLEGRRGRREYQNRFVVPRVELEADFAACGLIPLAHHDLIPGYSQWRYYLLAREGEAGSTAASVSADTNS